MIENCDLFVPPPPTIPPLFNLTQDIQLQLYKHIQLVNPLAATPYNP